MIRISDSDRKHKEETERIVSECDRRIKQAEARADEVQIRCTRDNEAAARARSEGEEFRSEYEKLLGTELAQIDMLAEGKIADTKARLKKDKEDAVKRINFEAASKLRQRSLDLKNLYDAKEWWHDFVIAFCIVWSLMQAAVSVRFKEYGYEVWSWINNYIGFAEVKISEWSGFIAGVSSAIGNRAVSAIVYWIILLIVVLLLVILFYGIPIGIIAVGGYAYLKSSRFDKAARWIMIGSAITTIAVSSEIAGIRFDINLLLVWMIVQIAFPLVRFILLPLIIAMVDDLTSMSTDERKQFLISMGYVLLFVGCIIVFGLILNGMAKDFSEFSSGSG